MAYRLCCNSLVNLTTTFLMANESNLLNLHIASIRLRNSGLKKSFIARSSSPVFSNDLPKPILLFSLSLAPKLLVIMIIQFLTSTDLPLLPVILASSNICNMILTTSGCAFSISSNNNILNGFLDISLINLPPPTLPSSKPTYPGGAPIKLEILCFS